MSDDPVQARFERAIEALVARVREDPTVLAVVLFGSLAWDTVWEKSDIDLMLVTAEPRSAAEKKLISRFLALVEQDVNIHAQLMPRSDFTRMIEGALRSSFLHSAFARSKLLHTRDKTLRELYRSVQRLGARDRAVQLFAAASGILPLLDKAQKFCRVKRDAHYSALWIAHAYDGLAKIEIYRHGQVAGRESIHQALALDPGFFGAVYTDFLDARKTLPRVEAVLERIDGYLAHHQDEVFAPLFDYLNEAGEVRSASEIDAYFRRHMNLPHAVLACEWLADRGAITKASAPVRLTRRSPAPCDELAFFYQRDPWSV